jgi:hypothetical protein
MFGLFGKKKTKASSGAEVQDSSPQVLPATGQKLAEWDATIAQIKGEFHALIEEKRQESEALVPSGNVDAVDRLWAAVESQLEKSQKALFRAWSSTETVVGRDEQAAHELPPAETKYHEENNELEIAFQGASRELLARTAQAVMQANASAVQGMAHFIGKWEGFPHWQNMQRAHMRIDRYRSTKDVPMELLHQYHDAAQAYWSTACGAEARLVPHLVSHLPKTIEARMKESRKFLRNHWQWRSYEEEGVS